ncbi:MAG: S8 family serine peptidase, partial [Thermoplasmata archaeon]|nr:S8 family serine peptidase [Thermoplasmata archaeon]
MEAKNKNLVSVVLTITVALSMALPTPLIMVGEAEGGRDYFFVEFTDCPAGWMKEEIYKLDGVLHQYYHKNRFLIEIDAAKIGAVKVLPFVSNVELYQPAYKMHSDLIDRSGKKDLIVTLFDGADVEHTATRFTERGAHIHKVHTEVTNLIQCSIDTSLISDIAQIKEVLWIEEDFEPVTFMNLITSNPYMGHDTPQAAGFNGSGSNILGEVQDNGCHLNHPDLMILWTDGSVSVESHGTCTTGIVFSSGAGDIDAQGIVYGGTGAFADFGTGRGTSITNLWNGNFNEGNAGMNGVFQSNSWGSALQNGQYTTYSNQDDAAANAYPHVLALWAMGNGNDGTSEGLFNPDAAAKNVVGVGAIFHKNTATLSDDEWLLQAPGNTPSRGPAADGRQKPDLCGPFDWIYTTDIIGIAGYSSGNYYDNFGGTSGATPVVAGSAGLIYDLYQQSFFDNNPAGNWPYSSTVKALLIADAYQYSLTNATRNEQGWGTPDMEYMYNLGANSHVIEEYPQALNASDTWSRIAYANGTYPLKMTLAWIDPAASASTSAGRALINNLDLKVTSPSGTVYWGNNGLYTTLWSSSGTGENHWSLSSSYTDDLNNVENVFVQSPEVGKWTIEVIGHAGDVAQGPQNFTVVASGVKEDDDPPDPITDLAVVPGSETSDSIDLTWTAVFEDGAAGAGTCTDYIVRYSTSPINNQTDFNAATDFPNAWVPLVPGSTETHTVDSLSPSTTYYFALEAVDMNGNQGPLSNIPVTGTTLYLPVVTLLTPDPTGVEQIISGIYDITWSATDMEDPDPTLDITVEYSPDGGSSWIILESGMDNNDGIHTWDTTTVVDGVNYLIRVSATDSDLLTTIETSVQPFSIDNILDDRWYFQVSGAPEPWELNMKPVEVSTGNEITVPITGAGEFPIGTWASDVVSADMSIEGQWNFSAWGYVDILGYCSGYMQARIYKSSDLVTPLHTTILDDVDVGVNDIYTEYYWEDTSVPDKIIPWGESIVVELLVSATSGIDT